MLNQILQRFAVDESGATGMEYALLGTLIGCALLATFTVFGESLAQLFNSPAIDTLGVAANSM